MAAHVRLNGTADITVDTGVRKRLRPKQPGGWLLTRGQLRICLTDKNLVGYSLLDQIRAKILENSAGYRCLVEKTSLFSADALSGVGRSSGKAMFAASTRRIKMEAAF
jgi:hypothetical protein